MTYKELYLKEHPECNSFFSVAHDLCPGDVYKGALTMDRPGCARLKCIACWNQEVPEEETEGFKAKDLIPVGEEVAKGIDKGILEPKPTLAEKAHEFQMKLYEELGVTGAAAKHLENNKKVNEELYEEWKKQNFRPISPKEVADGMLVDKSGAMKRSDIKKIIEDLDNSFKEVGEVAEKAEKALSETTSAIKDSGSRREFSTGAVRDIQEGKGRCDLMPLDVVADLLGDNVLSDIDEFQKSGDYAWLNRILCITCQQEVYRNEYTMLLEVAKHFEAGAKKYSEDNWKKGIPVRCYIDSAVRHYLKFLRGDKDEAHDKAFVWNILCCIWTCKHKPELNDYHKEE